MNAVGCKLVAIRFLELCLFIIIIIFLHCHRVSSILIWSSILYDHMKVKCTKYDI